MLLTVISITLPGPGGSAAPLNPIVIDQRRYILGAGDIRDGIGRVRHREVITQGDR